MRKIRVTCLAILIAGCTHHSLDLSRSIASGPASLTSEMSESLRNLIRTAAPTFISIPKKWIMSFVIDWKLTEFVNSLDLPEDTRARVMALIDDPEIVTDVVPFLLHLQENYSADSSIIDFNTFARKNFKTLGVPGLEHTLFKFEVSQKSSSGIGFDKKLARNLVLLYDSVFLKKGVSPLTFSSLDDQGDHYIKSVRSEASDHVKQLILDLAKMVKGDKNKEVSEMAQSLENIANDPVRLPGITVTLIDAVSLIFSQSYKMYQTHYIEYLKHKEFLTRAYSNKNYDPIERYIAYANDQRRYAVHIAVDGLQGNLVENLARGDKKNPFIKRIYADHLTNLKMAPPSPNAKPAPTGSYTFLKYIVKNGFRHSNYMTSFQEIYGKYPNGIARVGVSTTPTISVRNLPIIKTGMPIAGPQSIGIPNFHFVDRPSGRPYYFWGNDAIMLNKISQQSGMKTLFERISPNQYGINCNAQSDAGALFSINGFFNLAAGEMHRDLGDVFCVSELKRRLQTEKHLRELRNKLKEKIKFAKENSQRSGVVQPFADANATAIIEELALNETKGLPPYLLYYNPWPDHFSHAVGPFSDAIISPTGELNRLSYWMEQIRKVYEEAGVLDRTLFGMAGDHGLTPVYQVLNPEVDVLETLNKEGQKLIVSKISSDEGEGPKINDRINPPDMKNIDVVIASTAGGNYMMDFFIHKNWKRQPLEEHLVKLRTLAGKEINIIQEILNRLKSSLDYMAYRKKDCDPKKCVTVVRGWRNGQPAHIVLERRYFRGAQFIRILEEQNDILDLKKPATYAFAKKPKAYAPLFKKCFTDREWCTEKEWRFLASFTDRPDSVTQLAHLYSHPRAGTINLFPKAGIGYNTKVPGRHAGEHFHEKDAFVGIWGEPLRGIHGHRISSAVNGSVPVTIYEYLTHDVTQPYVDGWGYESLLRQ